MAVRLGSGFEDPPPRTAAPEVITALPEVAPVDPREIEVSLRSLGGGWLVPRDDVQVIELRAPAPRLVDLVVPRLRPGHRLGRSFGRRPE